MIRFGKFFGLTLIFPQCRRLIRKRKKRKRNNFYATRSISRITIPTIHDPRASINDKGAIPDKIRNANKPPHIPAPMSPGNIIDSPVTANAASMPNATQPPIIKPRYSRFVSSGKLNTYLLIRSVIPGIIKVKYRKFKTAPREPKLVSLNLVVTE